MTIFTIDPKTYKVSMYSSRKVAQQYGNGMITFSNSSELALNPNVTLQILVNVFNNNSNSMTKRFADKTKGAKKVFETLQGKFCDIEPLGPVTAKASIGDQQVYIPKEKKIADSSGTKPTKLRGKFAGRYIVGHMNYNPRRPNTRGFHATGILVNLGAEQGTISYEDYIEQGGHRQDLAHDLGRGRCSILGKDKNGKYFTVFGNTKIAGKLNK